MHEMAAIPEDTNCDEEAMSIGQPGAPRRRTRFLRHWVHRVGPGRPEHAREYAWLRRKAGWPQDWLRHLLDEYEA